MSRKKEMATVLSQEMLAEGIFSLWLETSAAAEAWTVSVYIYK